MVFFSEKVVIFDKNVYIFEKLQFEFSKKSILVKFFIKNDKWLMFQVRKYFSKENYGTYTKEFPF